AGRQLRPESGQYCFDAIDGCNRIRPRLLLDRENHRRLQVIPEGGVDVGIAIEYLAEVFESNRAAVLIGDDNGRELRSGRKLATGPNAVGFAGSVERTGWNI